MRLIDADPLDRMGYVLTRTYQQDEKTMVYETKKLSDVPSITPEPQWIPCSERLPEENSDILVTYVEKDEKRIVPVNYGCGTWFDCLFDKVLNQAGVLAWMPPPEPYREDGAGAERRTDDLQ